ncbi:hypothetical protein BESB_038850 [Besnoitia besnoiti]|uniref:Uncharacterized protein n=1 Tax=Besnoitia besnoiti TaxID=94643 RepID=A0A2A9MNH5_BESBE|nr:hypothetical protein BESB_038850 [Besnoitia besnoiti]PFH37427.1 hypothetical protein BESB_038850 [Besnoitia besnoiti]
MQWWDFAPGHWNLALPYRVALRRERNKFLANAVDLQEVIDGQNSQLQGIEVRNDSLVLSPAGVGIHKIPESLKTGTGGDP